MGGAFTSSAGLLLQFFLSDYLNPEKNRYFYKIEGLDPTWQIMAENQVSVGQLPWGRYTLRVRAWARMGTGRQRAGYPGLFDQACFTFGGGSSCWRYLPPPGWCTSCSGGASCNLSAPVVAGYRSGAAHSAGGAEKADHREQKATPGRNECRQRQAVLH